MFLVDIDNFKTINDNYGNRAGDVLLTVLADRLRKAAESRRNLVSRLAGHEYAVVLRENLTDQHLYRFCESIADYARRPVSLEGQSVYPSVSVGVARFPDYGSDENALLTNASLALKECKQKSPGKAFLFQERLQIDTARNLTLEERLRMTVEQQENGEMVLHYQPKVNLDTGAVVGIEALLRWNDRDLGYVSPLVVFDVAEKTALVQQLSLYLFKQVIKDIKAWSVKCDYVWPIGFNVHPALLQDPDSLIELLKLIDDNGVSRRSIILEITEDCILHRDVDVVPAFLQSLVDQGYMLSLDEFGTGFASLTSLKEIPSSEIKVDRNFVLDIVENLESESIVKALIAVGLETGKSVVAEGIETIEQLSILKQQNCKIGQGYLFSRAVDAEEISLLLDKPMPYASQVRQADLSGPTPAVAWRLVR